MQNSTIAKIALTALVGVAGVGFFIKSTLDHSQNYKKVDELLATDLGSWGDKELKVHGYVLPGSIKKEIVNQETRRSFVLQNLGKRIRIFTTGPVPDTFNDTAEVVATGHLIAANERKAMADSLKVDMEKDAAYVFDATELSAKCPSKYDGANINKNLGQTQFK